MEIFGIDINGNLIESSEFRLDDFHSRILDILGDKKGTESTTADIIKVLQDYQEGGKLDVNTKVQLISSCAKLGVKLVVGDFTDLPEGLQSSDIDCEIGDVCVDISTYTSDFINLNVSQDSNDKMTKVLDIGEGKYSVYKSESERGDISYHIFEEPNDTMITVVDETGQEIVVSDEKTEFYFLSQNSGKPEIWHGSIEDGFIKMKSFSEGIITPGIFISRDVIVLSEGGIISFENLQSGREIFRIERECLKSIIAISSGPKQAVIYQAYKEDEEGNITSELYGFMTDEDNVGDYIFEFQGGAKLYQHPQGFAVVFYDEESQSYTLFDTNNPENEIDGIQCFKDTEGKVYYDGEVHYITMSDGHRGFIFVRIDDDGTIEQGWYNTGDDVNTDLIYPLGFYFPERPQTH